MAMRKPRRPLIVALIGLVIFALIYIGVLAVYANSGKSTTLEHPPKQANGIEVQLDVISVDPLRHEIGVRIALLPTGTFEQGDSGFKQAMRVKYYFTTEETSIVTQDIPAGELYVLNEIKFLTYGYFDSYPIDRYSQVSSSDQVEGTSDLLPILSISALDANGKEVTEDIPIWISENVGAPHGWAAKWSFSSGSSMLFWDYNIKRAGGTLVFVVVVLTLMAVLAVAALSVSIRVYRKPGTIEATMASWQAALLFALIPLRNFLPGAPPIGAWIDILVFYWVILALMLSMTLFTYTWLRDKGHLPGEKKQVS